MTKYDFEISIPANDKPDATKKIAALVGLASALKTNELEKLAHIVKNNPVQTALAKKYLGL